MTKRLFIFLILGLAYFSVRSQASYINSISPVTASIGETVQISGSNLPTSGLEVFFGASKSNDITATSTLIKAKVPFGASFSEISIVNSNSGEIIYSNERFAPTFDGISVDASDLSNLLGNQSTFNTNKLQTQDLCDCDFDNDGDIDIIVTAVGSPNLTLFTNTSSPSNVSFTTSSISSSTTINATCRDLDGDGMADLVVSQSSINQGKLLVFRNNTTIADSILFEDDIELLIPNDKNGDFRSPARIAIQDLNLDGHPEVLVAVEDENLIHIYNNNSDRSSKPNVIDFDSIPISLTASENAGTSGLGGLDVADLNNDGLPDIIASNFTGVGFYTFRNKSTTSKFSFSDPSYYETTSGIRALKIGDLNNDKYNDIVLTNSDITSNDIIEIFENNTSVVGSKITFGSSNAVFNISQSWGLDLGDIDGDQDLDIVVASFGSNSFYSIINNSSTKLSTSDFEVVQILNSNNSRNIKLSDIDQDGKVDFVFTNKSSVESAGFLSVRLNHNCIDPNISPSGNVVFCGDGSETLELIASNSNHSFEWSKNGVVVAGESSDTLLLDATGTGSYTVKIIDPNGCLLTSDVTEVKNISDNFSIPVISADNNTPCIGDGLTLSVGSDKDIASYLWEGPNGFTSTDPTNVSIADLTSINSGDYFLTATSTSGCQKTSLPLTISVNSLPPVSVNTDGIDSFCDGETFELTTNDYGTFNYDWKRNGISYSPALTTTAIDITESGSYTVTISNVNCSLTSEEVEINTIDAPISSFNTSETTICEGTEITYTATSTGASGLSIINTWDFADGSVNQEGNEIDYAHLVGGSTYDVSMTAQYEDVENCTYTASKKAIKILSSPSGDALDLIISDNTDQDNFEKCREASLTLRLEDLYESYSWLDITASDSTEISDGPTVSVSNEESDIAVKLVNSDQCEFYSDLITVSNYTNGGIEITASSPNSVDVDDTFGKIVTLTADQSNIELTVTNALSPAWSPTGFFNDTTLTTVIATPYGARELVYVNGIDQLGCQETDSVTIVKAGIEAAKTFTPNNDGINDCWEVSNIRSTDCAVIIFDKKSRRVRQFDFDSENNIDNCVWDGTKSNGNEVPSGTYYYVIKCSDHQDQSSGAVLLAR